MKILKFRAWDLMLKKYVPFHPFMLNSTDGHEIERWAGLCDKNGVEIYEGDIVSIGDYSCCKGMVVEYHERTASFQAGGFAINTNVGKSVNTVYMEIMGNIHKSS